MARPARTTRSRWREREGREETGLADLRAWPDESLRHVAVVPVPGNEREPAHEHADLRFFLATDQPGSGAAGAANGGAALARRADCAGPDERGERPRNDSTSGQAVQHVDHC